MHHNNSDGHFQWQMSATNCTDPNKAALHKHINGSLAKDDAEAFKDHCKTCESCMALVENWDRLSRELIAQKAVVISFPRIGQSSSAEISA